MSLYSESDLAAIALTLKLAATVSVLLLMISTPLAWWLTGARSAFKNIVAALVALPLVLPPSVLGFYMLIAMGPEGPLGRLSASLGLGGLAFSFEGLVLASLLYSLPFAVQPLHLAFDAIDRRYLEAAAALRASPLDIFFNVVMPLAKPGFLSAAVLTFAHTVGEFGVVLMIGGNIAGETQVLSVQLYEHVETLNYGRAHVLAATLIIFSFAMLLAVYSLQPHYMKPAHTKRTP